MSIGVSSSHSPRVLFFVMQGNFSNPPLHALLSNGIEVCAVIIPATQTPGLELPAIRRREQPRGARSMLPLLHSSLHTSILQLASERDIPLWEVHRLSHPQTVSILATYQADIICVACFSQRIPRVILKLARLGCLNVHPSLLPTNRGPVPLFWTFREGHQQTGVTIHFMDQGMDTGDILTQEPIDVPSGIGYAELELQCATRGGELLARTVWDIYKGVATPVPQDEADSSYHPFPSAEDFVVDVTKWSARHVYDFVCGVASWGGPVTLQAGNKSFIVQEAVSYSRNDLDEDDRAGCEKQGAYYWRGEELWIRCKVGEIRIK
jgi:methionyl-tRNA formyltransferase